MDKKFQVFVSSTFVDLKTERAKVMQALMQMKCFPTGMEMFPALDEDQWEYIRKAIDECDYYVLVIAGRYGSVDDQNVSYTEKEYDYAVKMRKPVLALLHANPDNLSSGKTDKNDDRRQSLESFRSKVQNGRLVKYWNNADELSAQVVLGMMNTIERFPSTGWVKGGGLTDDNALEEVLRLGKENDNLREQNDEMRERMKGFSQAENMGENRIAGLDETVTLTVSNYSLSKDVKVKWRDLFVVTSSNLERSADMRTFRDELSKLLQSQMDEGSVSGYSISDASFDKIMIQFRALRYVDILDEQRAMGYSDLEYYLTDLGTKIMLTELAIKSNS